MTKWWTFIFNKNKVFSLGYFHSVQNVFLWWPNDELVFLIKIKKTFIFNKNKKTFIFLPFSFKTSLIPPCLLYAPPTPYFYSSSYPFWFSVSLSLLSFISIPLWSWKILGIILIFLNLLRLICNLAWRIFHLCLRRMHICLWLELVQW